jgi:D-3-phosphoglycerate dehydrogenase
MSQFNVALVALDAPGIPEWVPAKLAKAGVALAVRECKSDADVIDLGRDADLVWVFGGSRVVTAACVPHLPRCIAIVRTGSGTDNVPVDAATQAGIVVANTPDALTDGVSDHVVGLLFAVLRQIAVHDRSIRNGVWNRDCGWPRFPLSGRTLGLVGFGRIAQRVHRKLRGFELTTLAFDPLVSAEAMAAQGVQSATLDDLLARSDVVSIHCPLTPQTRHLIDETALRRMKKTAVLINTSRGPVIDEAALVRALSEGWIAAAGLDVLDPEPPAATNPLLRLDNVVLTPHIASYTDEYFDHCWRHSVDAVLAIAHGRKPASVVNRPANPRLTLIPQS